jgi:ATP-dependent helicase HrpA
MASLVKRAYHHLGASGRWGRGRQQQPDRRGGGFICDDGRSTLQSYPRYLNAVQVRLDKFSINPAKDVQWMQQLQQWSQAYEGRVKADRARGLFDPKLEEFRWMLEEVRVSLWAQQLKTPYPISFKRLERYWATDDVAKKVE